MTNFNTSIIIEEFNIKKDNVETPFEWTYIYDNSQTQEKTKELKLETLKIKDAKEFNTRLETSDLSALDFLALKGYIIPLQPLGSNPRIIFESVPSIIASKLLKVYYESFLVDTSLELKVKAL